MKPDSIQMSGASIALLLISTSLMVWYMHFREIDIPKQQPRAALHAQIVDKTAPSPYRYRVLVPFAAETMARAARPVLGERRSLLLAYGLIEAAAIVALILVLFRFFAVFYGPLPALVGALIVNLSLVVALRDHYFQPWSLTNAVAFGLAALLLCRRRLVAFAVLVVIASMNRETSVILPFLYIATLGRRESAGRSVIVFLLLCALWCGGYLLVRLFQGDAPYIYPLGTILEKNLSAKYIGFMLLNIPLFLGFVWIFAARGIRTAPLFIRRLALFVPFYIVLVLVFGIWKEVRLLMPLYPAVVPAALSFLFPAARRTDPFPGRH